MSEEANYQGLVNKIEQWAREFGFQQVGISDTSLWPEEKRLDEWLDKGYHGSMEWLKEHREMRKTPEKLHEGTKRIISLRMDYLPENTEQIKILKNPSKAYVSRYALGRDYHKLVRKRLSQLAKKIEHYCVEAALVGEISQRAFVDSAPVMERPIAAKAGLGWVGKHTLVLNQSAGSWFFLGEIFTNLPLPVNKIMAQNKCGDCRACLQICPTDAFPKPYELDARRCISYLTIEKKGPIPEEFREVMGNRVFGCDDCQAICPWNKYARFSNEGDFQPRHNLHNSDLIQLFSWNKEEFSDRTAGSPLRRIGYLNWLRNLSIGLGNADSSEEIIRALEKKRCADNPTWLNEHFEWALARQKNPPQKRVRKLRRKNP